MQYYLGGSNTDYERAQHLFTTTTRWKWRCKYNIEADGKANIWQCEWPHTELNSLTLGEAGLPSRHSL